MRLRLKTSTLIRGNSNAWTEHARRNRSAEFPASRRGRPGIVGRHAILRQRRAAGPPRGGVGGGLSPADVYKQRRAGGFSPADARLQRPAQIPVSQPKIAADAL